ncbi:MAG: hypothetical protein OXC57_10315 [Rhodobacteraceae bacterium]|nr:hypothetical protein [Paracoccaceae bacterium]
MPVRRLDMTGDNRGRRRAGIRSHPEPDLGDGNNYVGCIDPRPFPAIRPEHKTVFLVGSYLQDV